MRHLRQLPISARDFVRRHSELRAPAALAFLAVFAALLPTSAPGGDVTALERALASRRADLGVIQPAAVPKSTPIVPQRRAEPAAYGESLPDADFIWPVEGWIVQGMWAGHPTGIDIGANMGDQVRAVRAGTVALAGGNPCCEYGYFVVIAHDDGWSSIYGHLSAIAVRAGQQIQQGQVIGRVGTTGKSSGPHVHLELRSFGGVVDPLDYLYPRGVAPQPDPAAVAALRARRSQSAPPLVPLPAPPTPTPQRHTADLTAAQAAAYAANWLAQQPNATYSITTSACSAAPRGPNWAVTCLGTLIGCYGAACETSLTACVFEQPFLISTSCP